MSELAKRILTAVLLAPLAVWWLAFSGSPWFELLLGLFSVAALFELIIMLQLPLRAGFVLAGGASFALEMVTGGALMAVMFVGIAWMGLLAMAARRAEAASVAQWTYRFGLAYWMQVWLLLFVLVTLNLHHRSSGAAMLLGAFVGVWAADIGAYFAGKAFGRHRLCASVSPGKSIEGALIGGVFGIAAASFLWVSYAHAPIGKSLLIAVALVLTAILGDLAESAIKRAVGVKDSGRTLPGHGGLLDRVDALVPAVAIAGMLSMACL